VEIRSPSFIRSFTTLQPKLPSIFIWPPFFTNYHTHLRTFSAPLLNYLCQISWRLIWFSLAYRLDETFQRFAATSSHLYLFNALTFFEYQSLLDMAVSAGIRRQAQIASEGSIGGDKRPPESGEHLWKMIPTDKPVVPVPTIKQVRVYSFLLISSKSLNDRLTDI
jgi:hypothetical protein